MPEEIYNDLEDDEKTALAINLASDLSLTKPEIQDAMLKLFYKVSPDYFTRIAKKMKRSANINDYYK